MLYQKWKNRWSGEQLNALIGKSLAESTIQGLHSEMLRKDEAFDKVPSDYSARKTSVFSLRTSTVQKSLPERQPSRP